MGFGDEQSVQEWYARAVRWYLDCHQGCPSCDRRHCVFRARWGPRTEYYCSACDFSASHDEQTGHFFATPGDGRQLAEALLSAASAENGGLI
jgi:hypothetical protein